ncbi:MAG: hypothetical protein JO229_11660 [Alphaproteobacteria bacterium]|nr:hypothetical protein [Alphaproteobacteria bacterium]
MDAFLAATAEWHRLTLARGARYAGSPHLSDSYESNGAYRSGMQPIAARIVSYHWYMTMEIKPCRPIP